MTYPPGVTNNHEDNNDELLDKKSMQQQQWWMKVWKEAEHQRAEKEARQKAEEEPEGSQMMWRRKCEEVASLWASKKEGTDNKEDKEDKDKEWVEGEDDHDMLGVLTEVLAAVVVEMHNMAMDQRCMAAESCAQMEWMLGTLEEIWGCLNLEFTPEEPEVGSEEEYKEKEVAEA
ncbi:hypothetical protein BS17DRAFT_822664 [Gyrodon lividus]|nr:hypothetical protein BS17DRAFT_822664 [Gyrodon lividus]